MSATDRELRRIERLACGLLDNGLAEAGGVESSLELIDLEEQSRAVLAFLDVIAHELYSWCAVFEHEPRPSVPVWPRKDVTAGA